MKRWIAFVAALYPRSWREEFGEEFDALLEDVRPRWGVFADVVGGAIAMQITTRTDWMKLAGATALAGAIVAAGVSFAAAPHYVSTAAISVTPQPDPVRHTTPQALQQRAADHVAAMQTMILSRAVLSAIIHDPSLQLYTAELQRMPLDDVIEQMRRDIHIEAGSSTNDGNDPIILNISFSYPDQVKAQSVVRALAGKFPEVNVAMSRYNAEKYQAFWKDKAEIEGARIAPPPPVGVDVGILDPASLPAKSSGPDRVVFLSWGLGLGLLSGLVLAFALRWPHQAWRLGAFAAAGCILAGAGSYLLPARYTSTGVMMIDPAAITEDPLAPLPIATQASAFLRQMEPEVLSCQSLSRIIEDRRLNLYSDERTKMSMEEVVRNMLANLRITALNPPFGTKAGVSAFSISFSYSDRFKAQRTVFALMNAFDALYLAKENDASRKNVTLHQIWERKAGEVLDVLDIASLPAVPVFPDRPTIAAAGLGIGLLLGAITLFFRRHRTAALQPGLVS